MFHRRIVGGLIVVGALVARGDEPAPRQPTSPAALRAIAAYDAEVENATNEYAKKVQAAGNVAMRALEEAKRTATRHADLDEANAIESAIQKIKDASPAPPAMVDAPLGLWHVSFMNGASRIYRISPDGSVSWEENGTPGNTRPRLRRTNAGFTVEFKPNEIDRITFVGDRLYDDNFSPISDFPTKKPSTMGLGTR